MEFDESDGEGMRHQLENLWSPLQYNFGATVPSYAIDWELHKAQRLAISDTPVLIFLAVEWSSWVPLHTAAAEYTQSACYRAGIQRCVQIVHTRMRRITSKGLAQHCRPRSWYIQPIDAVATESKLNCGFFPGINWLLRAIVAKQMQL